MHNSFKMSLDVTREHSDGQTYIYGKSNTEGYVLFGFAAVEKKRNSRKLIHPETPSRINYSTTKYII